MDHDMNAEAEIARLLEALTDRSINFRYDAWLAVVEPADRFHGGIPTGLAVHFAEGLRGWLVVRFDGDTRRYSPVAVCRSGHEFLTALAAEAGNIADDYDSDYPDAIKWWRREQQHLAERAADPKRV